MHRHRVIPTLLLRGRGLVKTHRFKDPKYVGDPINAIRIFNEKEVDELIFLDIEATRAGRAPDLEILSDIAGECFMPLCYGGGVNRPGMIDAILRAGVEKVAMNSALFENPSAVSQAVRDHASSTIVASIDYRRSMLGRTQVYVRGGSVATGKSPVEAAKVAEGLGVGEIMLNCIDRDGTLQGYDVATLRAVSDAVSVPVIAAGGAGSLADFRTAVREGHASAVSAGAFFVFQGKHRAVLITYPSQDALREQVYV